MKWGGQFWGLPRPVLGLCSYPIVPPGVNERVLEAWDGLETAV